MGQYYIPVLRNHGEYKFKSYMAADYSGGLKLTEHSWWRNSLVNGIAEKLYHNPMHLYWVGDYSDGADRCPPKLAYRSAWSPRSRSERIGSDTFSLDHKLLVNHTKKQVLWCDGYYKDLDGKCFEPGWVMHPLSLLTAFGNGLGGGDYWGPNKEIIGTWGGDLISIEDMNFYSFGYKAVNYRFWED